MIPDDWDMKFLVIIVGLHFCLCLICATTVNKTNPPWSSSTYVSCGIWFRNRYSTSGLCPQNLAQVEGVLFLLLRLQTSLVLVVAMFNYNHNDCMVLCALFFSLHISGDALSHLWCCHLFTNLKLKPGILFWHITIHNLFNNCIWPRAIGHNMVIKEYHCIFVHIWRNQEGINYVNLIKFKWKY